MPMTYLEQLKSPQWQKRRLEILEISGWECANCGDASSQLHVHHKQYFKGRMVWEYEDHELISLCGECHQLNHEALDELKKVLTLIPAIEALALLVGYAEKEGWPDPQLGEIGRGLAVYTYAAGVIASSIKYLSPDDIWATADFIYKLGYPSVQKILSQNFVTTEEL